MKTIEEIREAFQLIHRVATGQSDRGYMSIPADPKRDADLIVSAAIDELEQLRTEDMARDRRMGVEAERDHLETDNADLRAEVERLKQRPFSSETCLAIGILRHRCAKPKGHEGHHTEGLVSWDRDAIDALIAEVERLKAEVARADERADALDTALHADRAALVERVVGEAKTVALRHCVYFEGRCNSNRCAGHAIAHELDSLDRAKLLEGT